MSKDNDHTTFRTWMLTQFNHSELASIYHFGVDYGWKGLATFSDTLKLYNRYYQEIWQILNEARENQGLTSIFELLEKGQCINVVNDTQFKNRLVWCAATHIAFTVTQGKYPDEDRKVCGNDA